MYQIKATLRNRRKPELGTVTIPFPIPRQKYDNYLEKLRFLEIGSATEQDCQIETLDSHYSILKRMQTSKVNLDELDYLAKRLESFCEGDDAQFQAAAVVEGISDINGFINLTFCFEQATVVQDFSDLEQIGMDHLMALGGGSVSMEELRSTDLRQTALKLLQSEEGKITPYGIVYKNNMEMIPLYQAGCPFPDYWNGEPLVVAVNTGEERETSFLFLPMAESRLRRELERYPIDPENLSIAHIQAVQPEEIMSSLQLEQEDIFSLNRLAESLDGLSQKDMQKLKAAMYLTEPHSSGEIISLVNKLDQFEITLHSQVIEPVTLELYMPLTAELTEKECGDPQNLDGSDLRQFADEIIDALEEYQDSEESERGLMQWYGREDAVEEKVRSAVFTAKVRDGQLWGVAKCQVVGRLTQQELEDLKRYLSGQASDGFGEGFEQYEIETEAGDLYVHLWNFGDWEILTEEECFGQRQKMEEGGMRFEQSF